MHLNAFKKCLRQMEHQFKELKKKSAPAGERTTTFRKHDAPEGLPQRKQERMEERKKQVSLRITGTTVLYGR